MLQIDFITELLKKCKEHGIHTAVDTAGHVPWEHFERVLPYTDLFLYDVKSMDSATHRAYTGVGNELILQNLKKLLKRGSHVHVRVPVVTGVNDTQEDMQAIKRFFDENGHPDRSELLPYHALGENKYDAIGREPRSFSAPDKEALERLRRVLA